MRENRPYGSEGGEDLTGLPYPYRKCMKRGATEWRGPIE